MNSIGIRIREMRIARNLTQQNLADALSLSKGIVSAYENSSRYPSYEVLIKLADMFHCTTDYLLGVSHGVTIELSRLSQQNIVLVTKLVEALYEKEEQADL